MFFYIVFTLISITSGLWSTGNTRKYQQIDVYIYQCGILCDDSTGCKKAGDEVDTMINVPYECTRMKIDFEYLH